MSATNTQRNLPAKVFGAGFAEDGEFYLKTIIKDVENDKEYKALVRLKDERDFNEHYASIYPNADKSEIRTETDKRLRNQGENTDLYKVLKEQVIESIKDGYTNTTDVDTEIAKLNMQVILSEVNIVGYMSNGVKETGEGFELNSSSLDNDDNKLFIATTGNVHRGIIVSDDTMEREPFQHCENKESVREIVAELEYIPASEAKGNEERVPRVITKEQTYHRVLSGKNLKEDSEQFEEFTLTAFAVADPTNPSQPNITNSSVTLMFRGDDKQAYSTRLNYNATDLAIDGVYGKKPDEYADYYMANEEYVDASISNLLTLQDPKTNSANSTPDDIAKMDALRIITMYTYRPNEFKEFSHKLRTAEDKSEVFKGVTAIDYSKLNETPSHNEKLVEQLLTQLTDVNKQDNVVIDFSQERRLNLGEAVEKQFGKYAESSINQHMKRNASAQYMDTDAQANAAFDVFLKNGASYAIKGYVVNTTFAGPNEQLSLDKFVPIYKFAPAPIFEDRASWGKIADHSPSYYAKGVKPKGFIKNSSRDVEFENTSFDVDVKLSPKEPDAKESLDRSIKSANAPKIDKEVWKGAIELKEPLKLGLETINDKSKMNYLAVSDNKPEFQMRNIAYNLGNPDKLKLRADEIEPREVNGYHNPDNSRLKERIDEYKRVLIPKINKLPVAEGEKHNYAYQKLNNLLQTKLAGGELSYAQQEVFDVLFSDKKIDIYTGDKVERHNFSELTKKLMDTKNPLPQPVRDDIELEPKSLITDNNLTRAQQAVLKAQHIGQLSNHARSRAEQAVIKKADEMSERGAGMKMDDLLKVAQESVKQKEIEQAQQPKTLSL